MNRIVRERYPVADLPEDLREGLPADAVVRVTVEAEDAPREKEVDLDELFAMRRPPYRTVEEIVDAVRRQRDEWDDR